MCIRDSINAEYGGAQAASMADRSSFIADPNGIELTAAPLGPAPVGCTSQLSTWMKLEQRQATAGVEMRAGLISFLTMSYVMVVNPSVMSPETCQGKPACLPRDDVVVATALSSAIGTLIAALGGNLPFVLAPGIGLSTYYASGLVLNGMDKEVALATVAISGLLVIFLSLTKVAGLIMKWMPDTIKVSTVVGMGLLIAFVGLRSVNIVVSDPVNLVMMGDLTEPKVILTVVGLALLTVLIHFDVKGGILLTIVAITLISWISGVSDWPSQIVKMPVVDSIPASVLKDGFTHLDKDAVVAVLAFTLVSLLDMAGVMYGLGKMSDLVDQDTQQVMGGIYGFVGSGIGSVLAGLVGSTPVIIGIESAAGIAEGGRTGLTALVVSGLFALSMFFSPLLSAIPHEATAPVLVMIGAMMSKNAQDIPWSKMRKAIPAFLVITIMPFTNSIPNGLAAGILAYGFLWLMTHPRRIWYMVRYGRFSDESQVASVYNSLATATDANLATYHEDRYHVDPGEEAESERGDLRKWSDSGVVDDASEPDPNHTVETMAAYFVPDTMLDSNPEQSFNSRTSFNM
eukprot:TRINITY_DN11681_c0_g1_i2.p1 TRINITY_DN11681_c0_g1~~TRINITY_DN11681_c0_g1_i2.p1  ORF type:complete len:571 (-),score=128.60 TRINITY_DN11681_c0_g1_i2:146-1858(-)